MNEVTNELNEAVQNINDGNYDYLDYGYMDVCVIPSRNGTKIRWQKECSFCLDGSASTTQINR